MGSSLVLATSMALAPAPTPRCAAATDAALDARALLSASIQLAERDLADVRAHQWEQARAERMRAATAVVVADTTTPTLWLQPVLPLHGYSAAQVPVADVAQAQRAWERLSGGDTPMSEASELGDVLSSMTASTLRAERGLQARGGGQAAEWDLLEGHADRVLDQAARSSGLGQAALEARALARAGRRVDRRCS